MIGEGARGRVFEATDLRSGATIALKTLQSYDREEIYRLKREFRMIAGLQHRNLVKLHDLVVDDEVCFFTMERVPGVALDAWLRSLRREFEADPEEFQGRARALLCELVLGIAALHSAGKLHRDIKPSNLLVGPDGRAVLLDFGMAAPIESSPSRDIENLGFAGTLDYMAPEVLRGGVATEASDWYALGVVVYEALTGRLPVEADPADLSALIAFDRPAPPSPRELGIELPTELERLLLRLLDPEPTGRPNAPEIFTTLAGDRDSIDAPRPNLPSTYVGRIYELSQLREGFRSSQAGPVFVEIEGESGIGKSALIDRFLGELSTESDVLVLEGRCHTQETLPYRALDAAMDRLSTALTLLPPFDQNLRTHLASAARIFPTLTRVASRRDRPADFSKAPGIGSPGAQELRKRAVSALRAIFAHVATFRPIIVWIDDVQWMDRDSRELLEAIFGDTDLPSLMMILTRRSLDAAGPDEAPPFTLPASILRRRLGLEPLSRDECVELASLLRTDHVDEDDALAAMARESGGNPFLLGELARSAEPIRPEGEGPGLGELLARRVAALTADERALLEVATVAGQPIEYDVASRAIGRNSSDSTLLRSLCVGSLLRADGPDAEPWIDVFHGRIRDGLFEAIDPDRLGGLHRDIANALEAEARPDANRLLHHCLEAGDVVRAADFAYRAAEESRSTMAFHRAVELYRIALEHGTRLSSRVRLMSLIGETLADAGRSREAASVLLEAATESEASDPDALRSIEMRILAAEHQLRSGDPELGMSTFESALSGLAIRIPGSALSAIGMIGWNRFALALSGAPEASRSPAELDFRERLRLQALWSAGVGLSGYAPIRSAALYARYKRLASSSGVALYLARSLAAESTILHLQGGKRNLARGQALAEEAERIARAGSNPAELAHVLMSRSANACFANRWQLAVDLGAEAERVCRDHGVGEGWELMNAQTFRLLAMGILGRYVELREELPRFLREATERGDDYAGINARLGHSTVAWLAMDNPEEAQRQLDTANELCPPTSFSTQRYLSVYGQCQIDLYKEDADSAWQHIDDAWRGLRNTGMLRLESVRIDMVHLRGRVALMLAGQPAASTRWRRIVRKAIRRLEKEEAPWSPALSKVLSGGLLAIDGRELEASEVLEDAAKIFEALGVDGFADASSIQAARMRGGEGLDARLARLRDRGASHPQRLANTLIPVSFPPAKQTP